MTSMRTTRNSLARSYVDSTVLFEKEFGITQKDCPENDSSSLKEINELSKNQDSNNDFSFDESSAKKRKKEKEPPKISSNVDVFCWRCHKSGDCISCSSCPRVYHLRCAQLENKPTGFWPCIECDAIKRAESASRGFLTIDTLSELLSYAIERMKSYSGSEHFCAPVNTTVYSDYKDYVLKPMDISQLDLNVKSGLYSTTESFVSDAKWMVHNSYIYNSAQSYLTVIARGLLKVAKQECEEIDNCQYCYKHAHTFPPDSWFLEPCEKPHLLIWAKLGGFPFWPAKVMKITGLGVDVRFFGDHNRSIVSPSACLLFSRKRPQPSRGCFNLKLEQAIQEAETHILKLEAKFQCCFVFANFRTEFDPRMINGYISQMLQKPDPENRERNFVGVIRTVSSTDLENRQVNKSEHVHDKDILNFEKGCKNLMIPAQTSGSSSNNVHSTNQENKPETPKTECKTSNKIEITNNKSDKIVQTSFVQPSPILPDKEPKIRIRTKEELNQIAIKEATNNLKETLVSTANETCSPLPSKVLDNNALVCNEEIKSKEPKSPFINLREEISNNLKKILIPAKPLGTTQINSNQTIDNIAECNKDLNLLNTPPSVPNSSKFILIQAKPSPATHALPNEPINNNLKSDEISSKEIKSYNINLSNKPCVNEGNNFKYFLIMKNPTTNLPTSSHKQNSPENKLKNPKSQFINVTKTTCTSEGNSLKNGLSQEKSTPISLNSSVKQNNSSTRIISKENLSINKAINDKTSEIDSLNKVNLISNEKRKMSTHLSRYTSDRSPKSAKKNNALMEEIIIHNSNGEEISPQKLSQILRNPTSSKTLISSKSTNNSSGNEMPAKTNADLKKNSEPSLKTDFEKLVQNKNFTKASKSESNKVTVTSFASQTSAKTKANMKESFAPSIINHQELKRTKTEVICSDIGVRNKVTKMKSLSKKKYPLKKGREVLNQNFRRTIILNSGPNKATVNSSWSGPHAVINDNLVNNSVRSNSEVIRNNFDKSAIMTSPSKTINPLDKSYEQLVLSQNSNKQLNITSDDLENNSAPSGSAIINKGFVSTNSEVVSRDLDLINEPVNNTLPSKQKDSLEKICEQLVLSKNSNKTLAQINNLKSNSAQFVPTIISQELNSKVISCNLDLINRPTNMQSLSKTNDNLKDNASSMIVNHQEFMRPNCEVNNKGDLINKPVQMGTPSRSNDPLEKSEQLVLNENFSKTISKSESKATVESTPPKTQDILKDNSAQPVRTIINQEKLISNTEVIISDINLINEPNNNMNILPKTSDPLKQCAQLVFNTKLTKSPISSENSKKHTKLRDKKLMHSKRNNLLFRKHSMKHLKQFIVSKRKERNENLEKQKISPQKNTYIVPNENIPSTDFKKNNKTNINIRKPADFKRFGPMHRKRKVSEVCNQDVNPLCFQRIPRANVEMSAERKNISENPSYYDDIVLKHSFNKHIKISYSCTSVPNGIYPKLMKPSDKNLPCVFNETLEDSLQLEGLYDTRYLNDEKLAIILGGEQYLRPTVVLEKMPDKEFNKYYEAYKIEKSRQNVQVVIVNEDSDIDNDDQTLSEEISPEEMLNIIGVKTIPKSINFVEELQMRVSNEKNLQKPCISEQAIPSISECDPVESNNSVCQQESNISTLTLKEYPQIMKTVNDDVLTKGTVKLCKVFEELSSIKEKNEAVNLIKTSMKSVIREFFGSANHTLDNDTSVAKECINQKNAAVEVFGRESNNYYSKTKKLRSTIRRKKWCSYCFNEAKYHCCFSASYCSFVCQEKHWEKHYEKCRYYSKKGPREQIIRSSKVFENVIKKQNPVHPVSVKDLITEELKLKNIPVESLEKFLVNMSHCDENRNKPSTQNDKQLSNSALDSSAGPSTDSNANSIPNQGAQSKESLPNNGTSSSNSQFSKSEAQNIQNKVENIKDQRQILFCIPSTNLRDFVKTYTPASEVNASNNDTISVANSEIKNSKTLDNISVKLDSNNLNSDLSILNVKNNTIVGKLNPESSSLINLNAAQSTYLTLPSISNLSINRKENLQPRNDSLILDQNNTLSIYPKLLFIPTVGGQSLLKLSQLDKQSVTSSSEIITSSVSFIPNNPPAKNLVIKLVPIINQNVNNSEQKEKNIPKNEA